MINTRFSDQNQSMSKIKPFGFLTNTSVGWKIGVMVFVLFMATVGVTISAYTGLQSLRYQLSNIYDFMLVPIVAINRADSALAANQYEILLSHSEDLSEAEREQHLSHIAPNNQIAIDVNSRYDAEWVTTLSPEFTQALRDANKVALQEQEVAALADYHEAFEAYQKAVDEYLRSVQTGNPNIALANEAVGQLEVTRDHLKELIDINNQYAEFSNSIAQNAYRQALTTNWTVLIIGTTLGMILSYLIATSITGRLGNLTKSAEAMQAGNLNQIASVSGRDEVGVLGTAFNAMTAQMRNFIATLEQRVADRTKALATSSEVSRRLSTILNQRQLVSEVVEQVQKSFNYYHVHIYFFDDAKENLVMAGGTGEVGKIMLSNGHKILKGRGLVGRAAELNEPVFVANTLQDKDWLPNPLLPETASEISVPITVGDDVLGVLDVQHNIENGLQNEDVASLQSIANQVAIAYQNIRQYENSQKIANDLGAVTQVGIATSTITDVDRLLQEVVDLSKKSFNLYHAHIYILNETRDTLQLTAGAGDVGRQMVAEKRSIALDAERSLVARAARTQEGVVVNDVKADPDFLPHPLLPDTRAELAVPMIVGNRVLGVLDVQSEIKGRFTDVDVNIQTTLASQIAVALQNAQNFERSKQQIQRETAVNLITQKIQSATNIETALQIAARELGHALGMKPTAVTLEPGTSFKGREPESR